MEKQFSSDGFRKYPSLRDHPLKTAAQWLAGRALDDGHDQLWRVGDNLYHLSAFVATHPGGSEWLEVTRGMDITEAFEYSHLSPHVRTVLAKYYVRPAGVARNSPYTFEPDGFYMTLKQRVHRHLSTRVSREEKEAAHRRITTIQDRIVATFFLLLIATAWTESYASAVLAGLVLMLNINCSHNFYHKKNNWRMYCWDLGLLSSYEWRITHALSHHGYTNTLWDFELSDFEPFADFRVHPKSFFKRYVIPLSVLTSSFIFFFAEAVKRIITIAIGQQRLRPENLLPLAELIFLCLLGCPFVQAVKLWLVVHGVSSYMFGVVGIIAAHHHPDMYHPGDGPFQYGNDWGLGQLDAVRDRRDVEGVLLAELTMYGNHILHHLFPTLDHGMLDLIRPVFKQTCLDFKLPAEWAQSTSPYNQWDLFWGVFQQLARTQPRPLSRSKSD
ncbi:cytochrome b5-related protein-like [Daphnia pulex]|uniref:cytochrome b5-related protein-like n=1 Tax=Daphnia pulex TaxID=6669 RepID=UPI001EDEDB7A|nr:cytochrome b5-related protein-like [Daphnia pulex]